ncbi:MAG: fluoride efflux transporter CrcB [Verrucomicrobiaceae bacterium]|nr:fluoride efflux transporter CrcB [Verrucomicrobiaceae bacterium]
MKNVLLIFIGGGIGSVLRYGTVLALARVTATSVFPWSIFVANLLGSFILGFLFGLPAMKTRDSAAWFFCATGVLGGYTTFSTLSNDSFILWQNHHGWLALLNSAGSSLLGIAAAAIGWRIAGSL